jgi:hypothetical protein
MNFYCPRESWMINRDTNVLREATLISQGRDSTVYIVVDFVSSRHKSSQQAIHDELPGFTRVATINNDLSVLQLLDEMHARDYWMFLRDANDEKYRAMREIRIYRFQQ